MWLADAGQRAVWNRGASLAAAVIGAVLAPQGVRGPAPDDLIPERYRERRERGPARDETADALLLLESGLRQMGGG